MFGKARERDAEPARQARRALGGWNGNDREAARDPGRQLLDDKGGGRAGAETEHHAALDKLDRARRPGAFQPVRIGVPRARLVSLGGVFDVISGGAEWRIAAIAAA